MYQAPTISSIDKSLSGNLQSEVRPTKAILLISYLKRPATGNLFDEQGCIICQTLVKSKKVSALHEDECDKLLQAASDRLERCDYGNIDVIDILRLVELKHLNCAGKEGLHPYLLEYHRSCFSSFMSAFHIVR